MHRFMIKSVFVNYWQDLMAVAVAQARCLDLRIFLRLFGVVGWELDQKGLRPKILA